ncbi:MAG TPA: trigger factor [Candidatus Binatia bacterium]|nr:trigger factor [Candidatus Binatia bacterium]
MKIDIDEITPVQRKIRVELPAETVASGFSRAYEDLRRRVRIKGFRAGKAPRGVLQGIYGDELKGQVRSQLVEESLGEVIKERGLQIVSRPEIEANDLVEGSPFSFSAVFEVKPAIEVRDYLGIEVEKVSLFVTDEQVNEALRRLRESHARLEPVENRAVVQPGDFVTLDFEGSIGGKPFQGGKGENYFLEIGGGQALPQFEEAVIGLTQGVPTKIQVAYPENYSNNELACKTVDFSVVVREIKQKVLPELDDDFAKDHGECGSLAELREAIRTRLENELKHIQQEELKEQIINRLIEACSFASPPTMVERQTRYLMERYQNRDLGQSTAGPQTPPSLEETRKVLEGRAQRQVQATLLVEKISQLEKIEVSDKEVQERVENLARAAGDRAKTVREAYSKPDTRDDLRAQMVFDRTLGFLLERALIKEVDAPATKVDEQGKKG